MIVRFWGVRGSVPVPGPTTVRYGGETSCISVEAGGAILVIDAGTGIRVLGPALLGTPVHIVLALTHAHTDHVLGFPFFKPLYEPGRPIDLIDCRTAGRPFSLLETLDSVRTPLVPGRIDADIRRHAPDDLAFMRDFGMDVQTIALNHPGGSTGFRIRHGGSSVIYLTDNELDAPNGGVTTFDAFVEFCRGADILIHDAQYLAGDMPSKWGWGHSAVEQVCALGAAAGVGQLVLFHHDPNRADADLDRIQENAARHFDGSGTRCVVAREGLVLES
jgi:phosphoribosyl 1,2-cyclic phosphodiesterase